MRVAIHQPNYLPWCGYFAKVAAADVLVFLDDVQMPRGRSYVHRTRIDPGEPRWLSVPVRRSAHTPINEVTFADPGWPDKHLRMLSRVYADAPFLDEVVDLLGPVYADPGATLAAFNMRAVRALAGYLGLGCAFEVSSRIGSQGTADDRLVSLVTRLGGSCYVSGKGGRNYQDPKKFAAAGVALDVRDYAPRPYPQPRAGAFQPGLSIVDALVALGPGAASLLG